MRPKPRVRIDRDLGLRHTLYDEITVDGVTTRRPEGPHYNGMIDVLPPTDSGDPWRCQPFEVDEDAWLRVGLVEPRQVAW